MRCLWFLVITVSVASASLAAFGQGIDTAAIDRVFGRSGQKFGDVYKVGFPRTDLHVMVNGVAIKPGFALGSWAAFSGTSEKATVMGDLVLLQDELNPVMQKLRSSGFDITAVHNHLLDEHPRVMYMHYMGQGPARELAESLRIALAVSKTPLGQPAVGAPAGTSTPAWVKKVEDSVGHQGHFSGGVLAFGIPRSNAITMEGMTIVPAEGVAESINFQEASKANVAATGDFVLTDGEVNPVISALEKNHISVTALHMHMLKEEPRLFFLHFWGVGSPVSVGTGIKAALAEIATKQ